MKITLDVPYGSLPTQLLDIYAPDTPSDTVLVWFHGGGLVNGSRRNSSAPKFAPFFTDAGYTLISVEYRMYPEAKFPDFIVDGALSVAWAQHNLHAKRYVIAGCSAGAYITMMLTLDPHYLSDAGAQPPDGAISDSSQQTTHFNVLKERGLDTRLERIDDAAPMYFVSETSVVPPMLMIYYTDDMPCRPEQTHLMYKSMKRIIPDQDLTLVELPGAHCHGTTTANPDGTYDFANTAIAWLKERNF